MDDPKYQTLRQQAENIRYQLGNMLDDPNHPAAKSLAAAVRKLEEDFQSQKNPRSLEEQVKVIQREIQNIKAAGDKAMDYGDNDELDDTYRDMREDIKQLQGY